MSASRGKLVTAFGIVYVVWGSTYLAIRFGIETIPPFLLAGTRFIIAGLILYTWARLRGAEKPSPIHWRNAFIIGTLLLVGGNGGVVWAEQTVPSGIAALLVATTPLWLVLLDWLRPNGKRPGVGVILGVVVGLIGMVQLIGLHGIRESGIPLVGAIVIVLAALSWAVGTMVAKSVEMPHSILGSGIEMIAGGTGLMLLSLMTGELHSFNASTVSLDSVLALLYLIIFGSLIAYSAYSWLIRHTTPAAIGTYAYVNPVIAVFLGWLIANESVTRQTLIGATIIVAAVALTTTAQARARKMARRTDG